MPSAPSEFPRPYVKYSVEPARAEDVPAAIARAYYVAMQPPCGPTFVSVPIDDWTHPTQPIEARSVSRELGPDPSAMKALVAALAASKRPALVVGPGVDRAQAVDLMVQRRGEDAEPRSGSARFRRAAVSRSGIRNSRASCTPRRRNCRTRCASMIWWS